MIPAVFAVFFGLSIQAAENPEVTAAKEVIGRLIGNRVNQCDFVIEKRQGGQDFYEYTASEGRLKVKADSGVSLCKGTYDYLRTVGHVQAGWQQSVVELPDAFPDAALVRLESPCETRLFLNVCQFGYTSPWWQWEDWEKMLDWLALHGYDTALAMSGQEIIWYELFTEMGVSAEEMEAYFAGPTYLPWQRMGNIGAVKGPLPMSYMLKQKKMQKRIIERMQSLGMTPVVPGFSGFVPKGISKVHPRPKLKKLGWKIESKDVYLLDLKDKLFQSIGTEFVKRYREAYGDVHYFLCDTFNENKVPVSGDPAKRAEELAHFGSTIYQSLKKADPKAVWVTQGWMFLHDKRFWNAENVESLFSKIPDDKVLIVDYGNDRGMIWKKLGAYGGKRWLFGYINNYGGVTPLQGDIALMAKEPAKIRQDPKVKNLSGFAFCPEASHLNYVVYAMAADAAWSRDPVEVKSWLKNYAENRYGIRSGKIDQAWEILEKNTYRVKYWHARGGPAGWGSFFYNKVPCDKTDHKLQGNPPSLDEALKLFFAEASRLKENPLYKRDALDFTRHFLEARADKYLKIAVHTRHDSDRKKHHEALATFTDILTDLDDLLSSSPEHSLHTWLASAAALADTPEEKMTYLKAARQQVTTWSGGSKLNGYASKGWHGMVKDFYLKRWLLWFENERKEEPDQQWLRDFETQWVNDVSIPKLQPNDALVEDCYRLYQKYLLK